MLPKAYIDEWRTKVPWQNLDFVEQDLILSRLLVALYTNPKIRTSLAFKGGTALHKLFLKEPFRYSEDLDFDQINAEPIGDLISEIRDTVEPILGSAMKYDRHQSMFILRYSYTAETPPHATMKIKIEINTRTHPKPDYLYSLEHSCASSWFHGKCEITTYHTEYLLSSKLKALYQRKKGRDLFDLYVSRTLSPNYLKIAKLFHEKIKDEGVTITLDQFRENICLKLKDDRFRNDITPLISQQHHYDIDEAADFVLTNYIQNLSC